jgi:hypothetical protein
MKLEQWRQENKMKLPQSAVTAVLLVITLNASAPAFASCNPASVVAQMNAINASSGACKKIIDTNASPATICAICRSTYNALSSLRATYKSDKSCFRKSPRIMAKVGTLWSYRADVKRLKKLCG